MCQKTEEERVSETERAHVQYTYPQSEVNVVAANFYVNTVKSYMGSQIKLWDHVITVSR